MKKARPAPTGLIGLDDERRRLKVCCGQGEEKLRTLPRERQVCRS